MLWEKDDLNRGSGGWMGIGEIRGNRQQLHRRGRGNDVERREGIDCAPPARGKINLGVAPRFSASSAVKYLSFSYPLDLHPSPRSPIQVSSPPRTTAEANDG